MAYSIDAKNNITLVRGDYFPCMINMTKDDEPFTPMSGSLRFAVKKRYTDTDGKVDKVTGKGLSTNDYTTAEKNKRMGRFYAEH